MTVLCFFGAALLLGVCNYFASLRPRLRAFEDFLSETDTLETWWAMSTAPEPEPTQPRVGSTVSRNSATRPSP
jgi:hypothetical protein